MAGPTDMVGQLFIIASDKTQIEVGETVHFSISYDENRTPENDIDIYINNDFLESIPVGPSPVLFNYTFEEDGIFYLYATTVGTPESNTIAINVDEATPQTQSNSVSWIINNKIVSSLEMNNKEIQSIVTSDNVVLYNINSSEYDAISLSSDKNILSYADSESCTLSAQLTDNGLPVNVSDVTVEFFKGSTSLGTADTNSSGVATKVYTSAGSGDISVSAEVEDITSNTISIEDCIRYDNATSDKTSNYSTRFLNTFTFNSEHYEAYRSAGTNLTSTFYSPIYADDTLPSDFEMSVMYKASNMNSELIEFIIASTHPTTYNGATELGLVVTDARRGLFHRVSGSATWYTESSTLSNDAWYTFYLKVEGTTVTGTILDSNDDIVYTSTQTISYAQDYKRWSIINGGNPRILSFKNLKIKPLRPFNNISLTSDENILSYADGDTCTLTAQLTKNGSPSPVEGETVSFYNGATLLGTDDTDSNGIATLTYTSAGVGDMSITASVDGIIVSETFSIRDFTYIADTMEKLATALTNVTTGNSIYLKDGTYSLPSSYTVSGIKLIGESTNAKIVSSDGQINFTDSIVDTIGMETVNVTRPVIYVDGTTTVKNCDCVSNLKPWDATVISVNLNNPDGLITIHDCYFHGDAKSNGFGHSCSAITGQGSVAYNVIIHHNTFNHPCNSGQLHGNDKGKAVCFYNGGSTTGTLNNVHLYCNEYLGCGDTNITVSEEICPDN